MSSSARKEGNGMRRSQRRRNESASEDREFQDRSRIHSDMALGKPTRPSILTRLHCSTYAIAVNPDVSKRPIRPNAK